MSINPHALRKMSAIERIEENIIRIPFSGCWIWMNSLTAKDGYGVISFNGKPQVAHRISYENLHGPIPDGLEIDHLCRVKCCVNPAHLEAVTRSVNAKRAAPFSRHPGREQTHCNRGHEFSIENTRIYIRNGKFTRHCRECHKQRVARFMQSKRDRGLLAIPNKLKTHCPQGHEFNEQNTWLRMRDGQPRRECLRCRTKNKAEHGR